MFGLIYWVLFALVLGFGKHSIAMEPQLPHMTLPDKYDVLAPDGSEIRILSSLKQASSVHCRLPSQRVSLATYNKTVSEIWYVLSGEGEIWRKNGNEEHITKLKPGTSLATPAGTHFQFRSLGAQPLDIFITTLPPWPGNEEAVVVTGPWTAKLK